MRRACGSCGSPHGIIPVYKTVDTCGAEFHAETPYHYSTYEQENESVRSDRKKVMILGGGPNRIGQGIEFDYCCVHGVMGLAEEGYETIMVNCNPETVSTDYDTTDKLYFEPLTLEDVLNICDLEKPEGLIVSFGGQTPLKLAKALEANGYKILGTTTEGIDLAEDRKRFGALLDELKIACPPYGTAIGSGRRTGHRQPDRLSGACPSVVRAGRTCHGDLLFRRRHPGVHGEGRERLARASGAGRPVPRGCVRIRCGCAVRRHRCVHRRDHAAH